MLKRKKGVITDGLWIRCEACKGLVYKKAMEERLDVCPECNCHYNVTVSALTLYILCPFRVPATIEGKECFFTDKEGEAGYEY